MKIFVSYAHAADSDAHKELLQALAPLERVFPETVVWHDGKIIAGQYWAQEIVAQLDAADVVLLLISNAFFASKFCWEKEMPRALARHRAGKAVVVPVFIDFVSEAWKHCEFADLQPLPTEAKPIPDWDNRNRGWKDVSDGLLDMLVKRGGLHYRSGTTCSLRRPRLRIGRFFKFPARKIVTSPGARRIWRGSNAPFTTATGTAPDRSRCCTEPAGWARARRRPITPINTAKNIRRCGGSMRNSPPVAMTVSPPWR